MKKFFFIKTFTNRNQGKSTWFVKDTNHGGRYGSRFRLVVTLTGNSSFDIIPVGGDTNR
ncbi:MAG: hypothetical protein ABI123_03440 [Ginsengibacter sp.]